MEEVKNIDKEQAEFVGFVLDTFEDLKMQFLEKNTQYKTAADPLANFRRGALLGMGACGYNEMYRTALGYENKHLVHVFNQSVYGPKVDESLRDIAIYSIIELYMVKKANEAK